MIPFSVWIAGLIGNARIIGDRLILQSVWIEGDKTITSMRNFDESFVQLFDGLDASGYLEEYSKHPSINLQQQKAVREYIEAFRDFDDRPFLKDGEHDYQLLLASPAWNEVMQKAQALVSAFPA